MSRLAIVLLLAVFGGALAGAFIAGATGAALDGAAEGEWSIPGEALAPRHDDTAFTAAFSGLRWPTDTAGPTAAGSGDLSRWRLIGVVQTADGPMAFLNSADAPAVQRQPEGGVLPGGVRVERVARTQVTLRDAQRCTLTLTMPARPSATPRCPE